MMHLAENEWNQVCKKLIGKINIKKEENLFNWGEIKWKLISKIYLN